jgi:capsule polysaccharide export protein KpsC/LpsZ
VLCSKGRLLTVRRYLAKLKSLATNKHYSLFLCGISDKERSFIKLTIVVKVIKLFSLSLMLKQNKLGCKSPADIQTS